MIDVTMRDGSKQSLTVGLSMCCKNEVFELDRAIASVFPYVDEIVVAYNGDNPDTVKVLEKWGAKIVPCVWKNHHGDIRQIAFDQNTTDLVIWMDADDEFIHPEHIPTVVQSFMSHHEVGAIWMKYNYEHDEHGNVKNVLSRERIVRRRLYEWRRPFHEVLFCKYRVVNVETDQVHVKHHATPERIQASGKRCLEIAVEQYKKEELAGKVDPLTVYDLGRAYMTNGMVNDAINAFLMYVDQSGWDDERYMAYIRLGALYRLKGENNNALTSDLSAQKLRPEWPDAFIGQMTTFFNEERWGECILYAEFASKCTIPWHMPIDPMKYKAEPLRLMHWAYFQMQEVDQAITTAELALTYYPGDPMIVECLESYKKFKTWKETQTKAIEQIKFIEKRISDGGVTQEVIDNSKQSIKQIMDGLPADVADHPFFHRKRNELNPISGAKRLVLFCGMSIEAWGPDSLGQGIGGSEEAVIHLMSRLAKRGWIIDVYGNTGQQGFIERNGVRWHNADAYDKSQPCEIFIAWRVPWYIDHACPEGARCFLWCHDVQEAHNYSEYALKRLEKIIVLSQYHRSLLPTFPDSLFMISRNGIDPLDFEGESDRQPFSCIYTSSPDRGLDVLLDMWPAITKAIPEATCKVLYGFTKNYDEMHKGDIRFKEYKDKILNAMRQPGIEYLGRVSHEKVASLLKSSKLFLYPAHFPEISCISAQKAQAAGAIPVCTTHAALDETVQHGIKIKGSSIDEGVPEQWATEVIKLLKDEARQEAIRAPMREWALKTYDWDGVADQWHEVFSASVPVLQITGGKS